MAKILRLRESRKLEGKFPKSFQGSASKQRLGFETKLSF